MFFVHFRVSITGTLIPPWCRWGCNRCPEHVLAHSNSLSRHIFLSKWFLCPYRPGLGWCTLRFEVFLEVWPGLLNSVLLTLRKVNKKQDSPLTCCLSPSPADGVAEVALTRVTNIGHDCRVYMLSGPIAPSNPWKGDLPLL